MFSGSAAGEFAAAVDLTVEIQFFGDLDGPQIAVFLFEIRFKPENCFVDPFLSFMACAIQDHGIFVRTDCQGRCKIVKPLRPGNLRCLIQSELKALLTSCSALRPGFESLYRL